MDIQNFETAYLNAGGKASELEKEGGEYVSSKAQMGWQMWQAATAQAVPEKSRCIYLNCNQLKQALDFGAPDLFSETKGLEGDLEFQLETEMSIEFIKDGHSGPGFYCWYSDLPEDGSILLTEELETQEND
ncbi:hypothetical protein F9230_07485 [Acinetobacter johnsonii]|uniref:hypothetical protein n=1 Tax=Acinetobacter johnsonii TaxID=40214 RepID=UPI001F2FF622|nr:hypothetical protein [Acinetobacter johnsonii]UJA04199.1 hypothetical protein F9230_07485 [Acinetobacter johnsonii]